MEKFKGPEMTAGQYRSESMATKEGFGDLPLTNSVPVSRPLGSLHHFLRIDLVADEAGGSDRVCCMKDEN